MFFSIIVPIYKVEKYLEECIESVLRQDFKDFELLLCDDESPDSCPIICDRYVHKDIRVRHLKHKNGGPSSARNMGMREAKGKYIVFLDGDDRLCDGILLRIYEILNKAPVELLIGTNNNWDGKAITSKQDYSMFCKSHESISFFELLESFARQSKQLPWRVYQTIIERDYLSSHNIYFDESINCAEDLDFFINVSKHIKRYKIVDTSFVDYRIGREGSIMTTPTYKALNGALMSFAKFYNDCDYYSHPVIMKQYYACEFTDRVMLIANFKGEEKEKILHIIYENENVINDTKQALKYKIAKFLWTLLGYYYGSRLLYSCWKILR